MASPQGREKKYWHTDQYVDQVDMRSDIVRMDFYRLQMSGRSDQDFYFEEVMNRFLSLVQAPVNFAVYNDKGLMFHFVNDLKYHDYMNEVLWDLDFVSEYLIPFYDQLFSGQYKIFLFTMHTKGLAPRDGTDPISGGWITPINIDISFEESRLKDDRDAKIGDLDDYLRRCAWRFFVSKWDGFRGPLAHKARTSLGFSLDALRANFRGASDENLSNTSTWPYSIAEAERMLDARPERQQSSDQWHRTVRSLFEPALADASSGLEAQFLLMQDEEEPVFERSGPLPNMIVAYRSFTRDCLRSGWGQGGAGYPYDTQLMIRGASGDEDQAVFRYFKRLKALVEHDNGAKERFVNGFDLFDVDSDEDFQKKVCEHDKHADRPNHRLLYSKVFGAVSKGLLEERYGKKSQVAKELKKVAPSLDNRFWKLLGRDDGPEKCVEILQGSVGDNARSFVDPVYHTGLIHFNSIFELGGLDRVGERLMDTWDAGQKKAFIKENEHDLLRIVMLYYLFSEMADWGGSEVFSPEKLQAVLVPIKMRGATFLVTLHAAYQSSKPNRAHSFQNVPRWMSVYHICTTLRQKNQEVFDREVLWPHALRRVQVSLEEAFAELEGASQYLTAIDDFNDCMEREQRYFPYALPRLSPDGSYHANHKVMVEGRTKRQYVADWGIVDNPFFLAPQPWIRKGTRSFGPAIEAGIDRGLKALVRKRTLNDETR